MQLQAQKSVLRQAGTDDATDVKQLVQVLLKTDAIADEIAATSAEIIQAEKELEHARTELERAKEARVPLADDADVKGLEREAELFDSEIEADRTNEVTCIAPALRNRVSPREFQWALGGPSVISDVTLRRYLRGLLPHPAGDRRNLWEPPKQPGELPNCGERPTARKQWILVDQLDLSRFSSLRHRAAALPPNAGRERGIHTRGASGVDRC